MCRGRRDPCGSEQEYIDNVITPEQCGAKAHLNSTPVRQGSSESL